MDLGILISFLPACDISEEDVSLGVVVVEINSALQGFLRVIQIGKSVMTDSEHEVSKGEIIATDYQCVVEGR